MSITKKAIDRKRPAPQLELVKGSCVGQTLKATLQKTIKRKDSLDLKKSKEKTMKMLPSRNRIAPEPEPYKYHRTSKYHLDRSKESKESKESLARSTHSYYIIHPKAKRSGSATDKHMRSQKSKEITNVSNVINSTFEMQSLISTHKKKQSNYSSVIGSNFDMLYLNRSALSPSRPKENAFLSSLLLKSETVLERYKNKNQVLQRENRQYKRKYREALKKLKHLQSRN